MIVNRKRYHLVILKSEKNFEHHINSVLINAVISHTEVEVELKDIQANPSIIDRFEVLENSHTMISFIEKYTIIIARMDTEKPIYTNLGAE